MGDFAAAICCIAEEISLQLWQAADVETCCLLKE